MLPDAGPSDKPDTTDTTAGACSICAARAPRGMGMLRTGAVVFGAGMAGGIFAWRWGAHDAVSGACFAIAAVVGLPLIGFGVRGVLGPAAPFLEGTLSLETGPVASPGQSIDARVRLQPDHLLYVQSANLELIALEVDAQGAARVLDVVAVPFAPGVRLQAPVDQAVAIHVPSPWPLTLKSPEVAGVARHAVETRLRLTLDLAAHPLFVREVPVVISAPA